jgi:hypothetical protein
MILKERLNKLFVGYDPVIQKLISDVLLIEQVHISMKQPHVKDEIDSIITRLAKKEMEQIDKSSINNGELLS